MITPTLAVVALASSHALGVTCDDTPRPVPPTVQVQREDPDAWNHYETTLERWWGRRHLCQIDTRATGNDDNNWRK